MQALESVLVQPGFKGRQDLRGLIKTGYRNGFEMTVSPRDRASKATRGVVTRRAVYRREIALSVVRVALVNRYVCER